MGKKYIVEIGRLERLYKAYNNGNGMPNMTWLSPEVDLTPYTEPDLEQVRKEAYADGYKTAKIQCGIQAEKDMREVGQRHYQRGLNDAWEAARKICTNWVLPDSVLSKIFGIDKTIDDIMKENTASECIEKIRQYEQEKKEQIQVGDEVKCIRADWTAVVTKIKEGRMTLMGDDGAITNGYDEKDFIKTGRHFPEIAEVLRKMGETNNG